MTIVNLHPTNQNTITFGTSFQSSISTGFYAMVDTFDFHENERKEILYSQTRYGGKAISYQGRLTPIELQVIVFGSNRNQMLERSEQLAQAVNSIKGGLFEYRPDGVSTSTFFSYEMSEIPKVASQKLNRWDDIQREHGINAMIFNITLQTHPFGHSQVFNNITPSRTTLDNQGSYNYFDLVNIKGDVPALVQVKLTNSNSEQLNRFYICSRSSVYSTLASLVSNFEAEDADQVVGTWANQVDVTRSNGNYQRLTGSASVWGALLFNLPSISNYEGLLTILPVIRVSATTVVCRVAVYMNGERIWTSPNQYNPEVVNSWHILYAGEFNFPPIVSSDDATTTLQLAVEFLGAGNIDVDFVEIFYSDEAIAQIDITLDATYGVQQSYSLLLETDLNNLRKAIVLDPGNNTTRFAKSIYGTLSSVLAIRDTRVFVLFQRLSGTDLHIPADDLAVSTKIIYRTTYPFRD